MTELKTQKPREERKRTKKVFATLAAVTMVGVAGVAGTTAALTATTENPDNEFDAAYLELEDNDVDSFLYDVENVEKGEYVERCIEIVSAGTAPATLEVYMETATLDLGAANVLLTIDQGTQPAGDVVFQGATATQNDVANVTCNNFALVENLWDPATDGSVADFEAAHNNDATGLAQAAPLVPGAPVVYRIRATLDPDPLLVIDGDNYLSGLHTYTWRATTA